MRADTPQSHTYTHTIDSISPPLIALGCVRVWDLRVRHPVVSLEPQEGEPARDCWAVAFGTLERKGECIV